MAAAKKTGRTDRLARLFNVLCLLNENSPGLYPEALAGKCNVSIRTTYRDLKALSEEMEIPLQSDKGKWRIPPDYFLSPINLSLPEAMTMFFASRLLLGYSNTYNPSIALALMKLRSITPHPLKEQIHKTIEWIQKRKKDDLRTLGLIAQAWASGNRTKIQYLVPNRETLVECVIEPYFIQSMDIESASHIIAYCPDIRSIHTFKIERIKSLELLDERYTAPQDFDSDACINLSRSVSTEGEDRDAQDESC